MTWYNKIVQDLSNIPDALEYYEGELIDAKKDVKIKGILEKNSSELPGVVEHRFNQLQEIEAILQFLNMANQFLVYLQILGSLHNPILHFHHNLD